VTSGTGIFTRTFVRYDQMPANLAEQVKNEHAARS